MNQEIIDFISEHRTCVVAVEMPDGSPHAATVHFAHVVEPLTFIIQTNPGYRKAEPFKSNSPVRVSLVVGTTEDSGGNDRTFQLDGVATLIDTDSELATAYLEKFPEKQGRYLEDIFLSVTPTWWRYTDWGKPDGKTIMNSDGTVSVKGVVVDTIT